MAIISKTEKPKIPTGPLVAADIRRAINQLGGFGSIFVPEFTWNGDLRIDGILIEPKKRLIRGFEIKVSKADFIQDDKWQLYTEFTSSLSIACPEGLIDATEVPKPFGLLYVKRSERYDGFETKWVKKPKKFQKREGLAWLWTYLRVLEQEFCRMQWDISKLRDKCRDY